MVVGIECMFSMWVTTNDNGLSSDLFSFVSSSDSVIFMVASCFSRVILPFSNPYGCCC